MLDVLKVTEAENFPLSSSDLNLVYFTIWEALHKNCIVKTSHTVF